MRRTILIIDDSVILVAWLRSQLEVVGYNVIATTSPLEAGNLVAVERPACVVLDMPMPDCDCGDVIEQIRIRDRAVPIILYSGQPIRRLHDAVVCYGASGCAPKKRDVSELLAVIERCVSGQVPMIEPAMPSEAAPVKLSASCLFVDDDTMVLRSYQRWFSNKLDADYVTSPVDALGRLHAATPPSFVIADIVMPGMSGLDLYARAICIDRGWRDRFLFVTGSDAWKRDPTTPLMRVQVLPKPVSIDKLHAIIDSNLSQGDTQFGHAALSHDLDPR
jgi:DNA-binding NtrC family response regulator